MENLTIEQQKEFEKMKAEINKLHNKLNYLVKENNKINKKLSSYEKYNDMPSEEEYADYYKALETEYCE